jgi:hypothetical protein
MKSSVMHPRRGQLDFKVFPPLPFSYIPPLQKHDMEPKSPCWGLLRRRCCLVPTWRGALVLLLTLTAIALFLAHTIYPFLAVNDPAPGGVLVVEGWAADWAMEAAVNEFHRNHYDKVFVTGGPLEHGAPLSEYKTYAELGAAMLVKLGLSTNRVQAVPAPGVVKDRTYACAISLKHWLAEHQLSPAKVNLLTDGAHARRSRMLFQRALGQSVTVGTMAINDAAVDWQHWWRSSQGVRTVISETLAYGYARLLFTTPKD